MELKTARDAKKRALKREIVSAKSKSRKSIQGICVKIACRMVLSWALQIPNWRIMIRAYGMTTYQASLTHSIATRFSFELQETHKVGRRFGVFNHLFFSLCSLLRHFAFFPPPTSGILIPWNSKINFGFHETKHVWLVTFRIDHAKKLVNFFFFSEE